MDPLEEVARLLAIQIRRTAATQAEAVVELKRGGFSSRRIADLLGTSVSTVEKDLQRARKKTISKTRGSTPGKRPSNSRGEGPGSG